MSLAAGSQLVGDGSPRVVASAVDFSATRLGFGSDACLFRGESADHIRLSGFRISFQKAAETRTVGVSLFRSRDCVVENLQIDGFNCGYLIALDSCQDCLVVGNVLRDCQMDASSMAPLSGVCVDDNRHEGLNSSRIVIARNDIRRLTVTDLFRRRFLNQTDGVSVFGTGGGKGSECVVADNVIVDVGEGIDVFGRRCVVQRNLIIDAAAAGIKLAHGASENRILDNIIDGAGLWGIVLAGSPYDVGDTDGNVVENNSITRIAEVPSAPAGASAAIRFVSGPKNRDVTRTTIRFNRIFRVGRAARAVIVRDDGPVPLGTIFHANIYDGSCPRGEFDHREDVDYAPPPAFAPEKGSAVSEVSSEAVADLFAFERQAALRGGTPAAPR